MKKISENTKVTLTLKQIKDLVKEARFGDQLKSLDDPAFTDTQEVYNVRKLRNKMMTDMAVIEKNEDLREAIQLLQRMNDIIQNRPEIGDYPDNWYDAQIQDPVGNTMPGITCNIDGDYINGYGIRVDSHGYRITIWFDQKYDTDDADEDFYWELEGLDGGDVNNTSSRGFARIVQDELKFEEQQVIADAIHKMVTELPNVLDRVEDIYNEFVKIPGIKVSEGRFAGKIKALDKVGEGRFAKHLEVLDAMDECGDEPVKLNEDEEDDVDEAAKRSMKRPVKKPTAVGKNWFESYNGMVQMEKSITNWLRAQKEVDSASCEIYEDDEKGICISIDIDIDTKYTGYSDDDEDSWDDDDAESTDTACRYIARCPFIRKYIMPIIPADDEHWEFDLNQGNCEMSWDDLTEYFKKPVP